MSRSEIGILVTFLLFVFLVLSLLFSPRLSCMEEQLRHDSSSLAARANCQELMS